MKKILLVLLLVLTGCVKYNGTFVEDGSTNSHDIVGVSEVVHISQENLPETGCTVFRFQDGGYSRYVGVCADVHQAQTMTQHSEKVGKTTTTKPIDGIQTVKQ